MPSPPVGAARCSFEGTAQAIHLRGQGAAVLVKRAPFSGGGAAKVELLGASIQNTRSPILERPDVLDPINTNNDGAPYDVTYSAGPPVTIRADQGGEAGHFRGALPGEPACASARGCEIIWSGAKGIRLHRASAEPLELTGAFPFGDPDPTQLLQEVTLTGARGRLRCEDGDRSIDGAFQWTKGPLHMLSVRPIRLEGETLSVTIENEAPPVRVDLSRASLLVATIGVAALLIAAVTIALLRRRKPREAPAPAIERGPEAPIDVFLSYAPEDEELCKKLEDHLRVLERRDALRVFTPRQISAGQERRSIIGARLNQARVILLLVSAKYMASDELWDAEVKRAMERHKAGEARVIPVILRPCEWQHAPFGELAPLPEGGEPVELWRSLDGALNNVAAAVNAAVDSIRRGVAAR